MTESDFRQFLARVSTIFVPRKIGQRNETWVAVGFLTGDHSKDDLEKNLQSDRHEIHISDSNGEVRVEVAERKDKVILRIPKIPRLNKILFFLTLFTTILAGTMMEGGIPWQNPLDLLKGIPFSLTLMLILGTHEFGHFYYSQKHGVEATLPYFIPAPPFIFLIGTFGAFIKMKSPVRRRDALLQIGAAGPIAGFLVALPALIIGLLLSDVVDLSGETGTIILGDSILMKLLSVLIHPGLSENQDVMLHPIAFAGWIGLLVTMLNLLPIGQLDGGHVAYAMLGDKHDIVAKTALFSLIPLSLLSLNWLVWGLLILLIMRTTKHPPVQDLHVPLSEQNKRIGYLCLLIFILCFIPSPIKVG